MSQGWLDSNVGMIVRKLEVRVGQWRWPDTVALH